MSIRSRCTCLLDLRVVKSSSADLFRQEKQSASRSRESIRLVDAHPDSLPLSPRGSISSAIPPSSPAIVPANGPSFSWSIDCHICGSSDEMPYNLSTARKSQIRVIHDRMPISKTHLPPRQCPSLCSYCATTPKCGLQGEVVTKLHCYSIDRRETYLIRGPRDIS